MPTKRFTDRLASESGIALPTALMLLFVIGTLASVALLSSRTVFAASIRDQAEKRALAAADAGVSVALYRLNKLVPGSTQCVIRPSASQLSLVEVPASGWCPQQTEGVGNDDAYTYSVSAAVNVTINGQGLLQRKIVATGLADGVTRRVLAVTASATGTSLFGSYTVISLTDLNLQNSARIAGDAGSNGNISLSNSAELCGNLTYGAGKRFTTANSSRQCPGYQTGPLAQPLVLNPVDTGPAGVNDNARIGVQDSLTGALLGTVWDPSQRVLSLTNSAVLTLTGNVYRFCRLQLDTSSQLIIAARSAGQPPLKIYIDDPADCPGVSDPGSVRVRNNSTVLNLNTSATSLQLMVSGSPVASTSVEFSNNSSLKVPLVVYAPRSTVSLQNSAALEGAVAAKTLSMTNSASVTGQAGTADVHWLTTLFQRQSWVECPSKNLNSAPDSGC